MRSRRAATAMLCLAAIECAVASGCSGTPSDQVAASTKEVSFVVDGTTTCGSLQIPARRRGQQLAAALLLAGSGDTDRDGNQKPNLTPNTLRQIADSLAGVGVITLRFNKILRRRDRRRHLRHRSGLDRSGRVHSSGRLGLQAPGQSAVR